MLHDLLLDAVETIPLGDSADALYLSCAELITEGTEHTKQALLLFVPHTRCAIDNDVTRNLSLQL